MIMLALGVIFNTLIVMPRGMSMLSNSKVMLGAAMAFLILSAPLSVLSTGAVEGAVEDNFETYPTDTACANDDCTEAEADWATSTGERSYMAWNITNYDAIQADPTVAPVYQEVGPFDYDITYTREIIDFNKTAGTLTYSESKVYTCAEDTRTPCDLEVTTTNIPFQPQVVGGTGTAVAGIMDLTKAGFAAGAIGQEMESFSAAKTAASWVTNTMAGGYVNLPTANDAANPSIAIGMNWYNQFDGYFAAMNLSGMNNMQGMGETINYTQAVQGQGGVTFTGSSSITDLTYAFDSAVMPSGENAALSTMLGVLLYAGHCNAYPTATYAEVMADAANGFANVGTMQRANIWQYTVMADATTLDINSTIANDYAVCTGLGGMFANVFGGGDEDWFQDTTGTAVNASARIMNHLGINLDNMVAMNLLFGGNGEAVPTGLLATNPEGTSFGVANFFGMDADTAKTTYMLDDTQYGAVYAWVGGWLGSISSLPMVLLGGTGDMTAERFVNVTFGGLDPINGGYLTYSLNAGGAYGTALLPESPQGGGYVSVDEATAGSILYGPLGIGTRTGATLFMYGEMMGETPPIDFTALATTGQIVSADPLPWVNATIAALYGIDTATADALQYMLRDGIYEGFVPDYLVGLGSDGVYKTQTVNQWLFGWFDPISAGVADDPTAPEAGWTKLETNQTYYGSGGVSTGPATTYTICTGHNPDCDKGETLLEDGSPELPWHSTMISMSTFGLIEVEYLNETTGGFLTGSGDKVDAGGYAITDVVCSVTGEVKSIPVNKCSASVDPTTRPITAKLIGSESLLDAMTPALPVYFGTEITLMSEELSGLIISGSSTSTFYLDTRDQYNRATAPMMSDLQPVFQIVQSSEIEDDDAEDMESAIVTNQNALSYWTNFDVPTDYVALLLYLGALTCLVLGVMALGNEEEEAKDYSSETAEAESSDAGEA